MWYNILIISILLFLMVTMMVYIWYKARKRKQETPIINLEYIPPNVPPLQV